MALVDFNQLDKVVHHDHASSIDYINSLEGGDFSDTYQTVFGPIRENSYVIRVYSLDDASISLSIELSDAAQLVQHMDVDSGPEVTQEVSVPDTPDWYESDNLPIRKLRSFKQEESTCEFCRTHGKRTNELYCDVPNRVEYSNGWTHPVLAPGKSGTSGFHEDCLAFVSGFIKRFKKKHSELFVSATI